MKSLLKPAIRLRGHHLICLHFFSGEGYDSEFIENLKRVLGKAETGEVIEVTSGSDDVCKRCPYLKRGRCLYDNNAEQEIREMDRRAIQLLGVKSRRKLTWMEIRKRIPGILREWSRDYCTECDWKKVCERLMMSRKHQWGL